MKLKTVVFASRHCADSMAFKKKARVINTRTRTSHAFRLYETRPSLSGHYPILYRTGVIIRHRRGFVPPLSMSEFQQLSLTCSLQAGSIEIPRRIPRPVNKETKASSVSSHP